MLYIQSSPLSALATKILPINEPKLGDRQEVFERGDDSL